ncbi:MAG: hypothetical protein VKP62_15390 [Candidatus Sericytochromatia bacterium]|nr:hypothetical protein [Candidatus Sericytochromatia bacterium]
MSILSKAVASTVKHAMPTARQAAVRTSREVGEELAPVAARAAEQAVKPIALLPPAASVREIGRKVGWVEAGWQRQERLMRRMSPSMDGAGDRLGLSRARTWMAREGRAGVVRHNQGVVAARKNLEQFSNGPLVRAASRDLGRTARALDGPAHVVLQTADFVYQFVPFRPVFDRLALVQRMSQAYDAVKTDPNSVRRWVKGLGDKLPTF